MTSRPFVAALAVLALTGSACLTRSVDQGFDVAAPEPVPMPPELVDPPMPGGPPDTGGGQDGEAQMVEQRDDIENPTPTPWERTSWQRESQELTVYWTSGVEPCTAFAGLEIEYRVDEVVVTVLEGAPPEAAAISCIMMAVQKQFTIVLDEDLGGRRIVDGAL